MLAAAPATAATQTWGTPVFGGYDWVVPAGVTTATFEVLGAPGGGTGGSRRGAGGKTVGTIAVTPGETLKINVGGAGLSPGFGGGRNGGAGAGSIVCADPGGGLLCVGASGGGASDVRQGGTAVANGVLVAGGDARSGGGGGGGGSGFAAAAATNVSILSGVNQGDGSVTVTYGTHTLSVTKSGTGSGTVTSSPAGIDCGTTCTHAYDAGTSGDPDRERSLGLDVRRLVGRLLGVRPLHGNDQRRPDGYRYLQDGRVPSDQADDLEAARDELSVRRR